MWCIPRKKISASWYSKEASARLIAFFAQHCGSVLSDFSKNRSKALSNSGINCFRSNSRTRSAAFAARKLLRLPSALRSASTRSCSLASRSASSAAICCSKAFFAGMCRSVLPHPNGGEEPTPHLPHGIQRCASCTVGGREVSAWRLAVKQGNHGNSHGRQEQPRSGEGKDRHLHNPIEDRLI